MHSLPVRLLLLLPLSPCVLSAAGPAAAAAPALRAGDRVKLWLSGAEAAEEGVAAAVAALEAAGERRPGVVGCVGLEDYGVREGISGVLACAPSGFTSTLPFAVRLLIDVRQPAQTPGSPPPEWKPLHPLPTFTTPLPRPTPPYSQVCQWSRCYSRRTRRHDCRPPRA